MVKHAILLGMLGLIAATGWAQSFTKEILQAATDGNRKVLEALRAQALNDEERLIVNALLERDGTVAAKMYQSLIAKNPSSPFLNLAQLRLREYDLALGGRYTATTPAASLTPNSTEASEPKQAEVQLSAQLSDILPKPVPDKTARSGLIRFTIQFGSFSSRAQAETLQKQLRSKVATRIVEVNDDSGKIAYKVRSEAFYDSKFEATVAAKKLNLDFYVVAE